MENWQRVHIKENWADLIDNTHCNILLLGNLQQNNVLSEEEVDILKLQTLTDREKSDRLYTILLTRKGSFDVLIETLKKTNQTGAVDILQQTDPYLTDCGLISYDKDKLLGTGSSANVFLGKFNGRVVAVKLINVGAKGVDLAVGEIKRLKNLEEHENVVRYFFAEKRDMSIYIAMELCYVTLQDEVKNNWLSVNSVSVLEKCTKGICHLHKLGVVHRDLTPSNILLTESKQVKISDLGLSKKLPDGTSSVFSTSGAVGSLYWMAPEVLKHYYDTAKNKSPFKTSKSSDIFSLGCIFYYVLTKGSHAFGHPADIQANICDGRQQMQNSDIQTEWLSIIRPMISLEKKQRPSANKILSLIIDSPMKKSSASGTESNAAAKSELFGTFKSQVRSLHEGLIVATEILLIRLFIVLFVVGCVNRNITNLQGETVLHLAVQLGIHSDIKYFISLGADIHSKDISGNMPIHRIQYTEHNFKKTLDALLDSGADINAKRTDGTTALELTVLHGRSREDIEYLVKLRGDWKITNDKGQSVLHLAAEGGNQDAIKYFIDLGADIHSKDNQGDMPIHRIQYTKQNFKGTLDALLNCGADINDRNKNGNTPLGLAALSGRSILELEDIVIRGGDWKIKNYNGRSVLHLAAEGGNQDAIKYLFNLGLDIHSKDNVGEMPIHRVQYTKQNYKETLDALLDCGADINAKRKDTLTPLILAAVEARSKEEIEYAVTRGGDWKIKNDYFLSILHSATEGGNPDAIKYFINLGADVHSKCHLGNAPIHRIQFTKQNFQETLDALLDCGADINDKRTDGNTALGLAARRGRSKAELEYLVTRGADWKIKNSDGLSVLHLAAEGGNSDAIKYFIELGTDIHLRNSLGQMPIHAVIIAWENFKETLSTLLNYGADINAKDNDGLTLFGLAQLKGRSKEELEFIVNKMPPSS